jgi:hypothetical protein
MTDQDVLTEAALLQARDAFVSAYSNDPGNLAGSGVLAGLRAALPFLVRERPVVTIGDVADLLGTKPGSPWQLEAECNGAAAMLDDSPNRRLFLACAEAMASLRHALEAALAEAAGAWGGE